MTDEWPKSGCIVKTNGHSTNRNSDGGEITCSSKAVTDVEILSSTCWGFETVWFWIPTLQAVFNDQALYHV